MAQLDPITSYSFVELLALVDSKEFKDVDMVHINMVYSPFHTDPKRMTKEVNVTGFRDYAGVLVVLTHAMEQMLSQAYWNFGPSRPVMLNQYRFRISKLSHSM